MKGKTRGWMALVCLLCLPQMALAGAWTLKEGGMYNRFAFNYYYSDRLFGSSGGSDFMPMRGRFYDKNLNWYEEYGVTDRITVLSSVYYKWLNANDMYVKSESEGVGDVDLGIKYKLYDGPVVVSVQGLIKYGQLYDNENPQIGNHQNDYELRLLLGRSLWPLPAYCGLELAYRLRDNGPSDEFRYLLEFGGNLSKKLSARIKLDGIHAIGNADSPKSFEARPQSGTLNLNDLLLKPVSGGFSANTGQQVQFIDIQSLSNPTLATEYDLIKLDMTLAYQLTERLGVEVEVTPAIYGENTSKGVTSTLAFTYTW